MKRSGAAAAPSLRPKSAAAWRSWLEKHHASALAVLLVYARKQTGKASLTWHESVDHALCFGWVDGVRGKLDDEHFTVRFTPRKSGSIWSKLNLARVERLREAGLMHPSGLAAYETGKQSGRHAAAYAIRDEVKMPAELKAALAASSRGRAAFEALKPGEQKAWMRHVAWATRAETRVARARDALRLILAGRKAGETDNQAARRGIPSKASILGKLSPPTKRALRPR
jgi:uncharacterized protein YdeI (YjbR/CyaY-like superfamily)